VTILSPSISGNSGVPPALARMSLKAQSIRLECQPIGGREGLGPTSVAAIDFATGVPN